MKSESLQSIESRTVDLLSEEELNRRLQESGKTGRPLRIKLGADPSAPDLHFGHVVVLNKLRSFQELGHQIVFIIGDMTAMIGDPSGRSQTRKPLSHDEVLRNAATYKEQVSTILDPKRTEVRFNSEWCAGLNFEDVLKLSSHVTIAQMLAREDFSNRYQGNQPISLVEFMYPLIQAYDSVQIEADVEIGGTDQLFNLLLGRELQKAFGQEPQIVMTLPLLEGLDGVQKMSKSLGNYVAVTDSPREMFGKIMSVSDDLMWRYADLVLCADDACLENWREQHPREAKDSLAVALVNRFHGSGVGEEASSEFARVFREKKVPDDMPHLRLASEDLAGGSIGVLKLLVRSKLVSSNSEARRMVEQGAVRFGEDRINDHGFHLNAPFDGILRCGKRGFVRVSTK